MNYSDKNPHFIPNAQLQSTLESIYRQSESISSMMQISLSNAITPELLRSAGYSASFVQQISRIEKDLHMTPEVLEEIRKVHQSTQRFMKEIGVTPEQLQKWDSQARIMEQIKGQVFEAPVQNSSEANIQDFMNKVHIPEESIVEAVNEGENSGLICFVRETAIEFLNYLPKNTTPELVAEMLWTLIGRLSQQIIVSAIMLAVFSDSSWVEKMIVALIENLAVPAVLDALLSRASLSTAHPSQCNDEGNPQ